eukprot:3250930-Pleurochrysis_carterae.AAC.1
MSVAFAKLSLSRTCRNERRSSDTRASLLWVIEGVSTKRPTPQQLHALSLGERCEISPRQSKCDATGE